LELPKGFMPPWSTGVNICAFFSDTFL
jgi:hypothetical protein